MGILSDLPNIGEVVEKQLNDVGITTYEQLKECGSKQAWLKIRAIDLSINKKPSNQIISWFDCLVFMLGLLDFFNL
ncbi:MAG: TfoX protein [Firmicutes bacterium]|nr:TfoX protein [Bacillota bacterium]